MPQELTGPGVHIEEQPGPVHAISGMDTAVTAFIGSAPQGLVDHPAVVPSWAEYTALFGFPTGEGRLGAAVGLYFLNGGQRALIVRVAGGGTTVEDHVPADPGSGRGLYALDPVDALDVLCVPDLCAGPFALDEKRKALTACLAYCQRRRAMLIVDPPPEWNSVAAVRKGVSGAPLLTGATENAALYVPWLTGSDPVSGVAGPRPPSGAVAGVWARTDATRGVWHAPAGTVSGALEGVPGLTVALTDADAAELARSGVNCLRDLPGVGPVVWGARTLHDQRDPWQYLAVRRLGLHVEESVARGTEWAVFEPNDEPLWAQLRLTVGSFLAALWQRGALVGRTPQEAYMVRCGADTTTQADIDRGVVDILVGFAPLRPAEFVVLHVRQSAARTRA